MPTAARCRCQGPSEPDAGTQPEISPPPHFPLSSLLDFSAILYRQILQKCCTCRNNPHPGTRICLMPAAGPRGHSVCLQDCSCIGTGCCRTFQARSLSHFFLTFHSSSFATFEIVFLHCGLNSDALRLCSV